MAMIDDLLGLDPNMVSRIQQTANTAPTGGPALAPQQQQPITPVPPQQADDTSIEVQGDTWKPKKAGWLGGILDTLLSIKGRGTPFVDRKNLASALQGWQKDPEQALARIRQFDPSLAVAFATKFSQEAADKALEQSRLAQSLQRGGAIITGGLQSILRAPEGQRSSLYSRALPSLQRFAEMTGYPQDLFPTTYDEGLISTLADSGITGYQQLRLDQGDEVNDIRRESIGERRDYHGATIKERQADRASRESEGNKNRGVRVRGQNVTMRGQNITSKDRGLTLQEKKAEFDKKYPPITGPDGHKYRYIDKKLVPAPDLER